MQLGKRCLVGKSRISDPSCCFRLKCERLKPLAQIGAHPRITPSIGPARRCPVAIFNPCIEFVMLNEKPWSSRLISKWVRKQHPNISLAVASPVNRRPPLHLNWAKLSVRGTDHQVLAVYVGFGSVHSVTRADKYSRRLCAVGRFDFVGAQGHSVYVNSVARRAAKGENYPFWNPGQEPRPSPVSRPTVS